MEKVRIIKVMYCAWSDDPGEDPDLCAVHNSKRIPSQEICEAVKEYAIEELKKEKERASAEN